MSSLLLNPKTIPQKLLDTSSQIREIPQKLSLLIAGLFIFVRLTFVSFTFPLSFFLYQSVTSALLTEQNWAKQAIFAHLDYAVVPYLPFILIQMVVQVFPTFHPWITYVCFVGIQALIFVLLHRCVILSTSSRWIQWISLFCLYSVLIITAHDLWAPLHPAWFCVFLILSGIYFILRWRQSQHIRDFVWGALTIGTWPFCGLPGMILCCLTLLMLTGYLLSIQGWSRARFFLLVLPTIYSFCLYTLANFFIMTDPWFPWKRLYEWSNFANVLLASSSYRDVYILLGVFSIIGLIALIYLNHLTITWWAIVSLSFLFLTWLRSYSLPYFDGEHFLVRFMILFFFLILGADILSMISARNSHQWLSCILGSVALLVCWYLQETTEAFTQPYESLSDPRKPSPKEIIQYVDQHWKDSRILVYGLPTCVLYCTNHPYSQRFIGHIDYNPYVLLQQKEAEQLHILLPPANGRYYPLSPNPFYNWATGSIPPWLFLEQKWPATGGGYWTLWRCIRTSVPPYLLQTRS